MFIYIFLLVGLSSALLQPKLCINCKYFAFNNDLSSGNCLLFRKKEDPNEQKIKLINFLVTGLKKEDNDSVNYLDCLIAREHNHICGLDGKKYEKNNLFFFNP